jgi:hypothetical protein
MNMNITHGTSLGRSSLTGSQIFGPKSGLTGLGGLVDLS